MDVGMTLSLFDSSFSKQQKYGIRGHCAHGCALVQQKRSNIQMDLSAINKVPWSDLHMEQIIRCHFI